MNNIIKQVSYTLSFFILLTFSVISNANVAETYRDNDVRCAPSGVGFGFFNGVNTTDEEADEALRKFQHKYGDKTPNGETIKYELFYNQTEGLRDFAETFEQRLQEQEGILAGRFELFWEALNGGGSWWDAITEAIPSTASILADYLTWVEDKTLELLTSWIETPSTLPDYAQHQAQVVTWVQEGRKMLFVAHSQGNLFVNKAYDYALTQTNANSVEVIHIAPASPTVNGPHVLADGDLVIDKLLRWFAGDVPKVTDNIPAWSDRPAGINNETDLLGHGLLEIYLNPHLTTANRIDEYIKAALESLTVSPSENSGNLFMATLLWDGFGDVDLHALVPDPEHSIPACKKEVEDNKKACKVQSLEICSATNDMCKLDGQKICEQNNQICKKDNQEECNYNNLICQENNEQKCNDKYLNCQKKCDLNDEACKEQCKLDSIECQNSGKEACEAKHQVCELNGNQICEANYNQCGANSITRCEQKYALCKEEDNNACEEEAEQKKKQCDNIEESYFTYLNHWFRYYNGEETKYELEPGYYVQLNRDNKLGFGPEFFSFLCSTNATLGTYKFYAVNFSWGWLPPTATLQISSSIYGILASKSVNLPQSQSPLPTHKDVPYSWLPYLPMLDVTIYWDPTTGYEFIISEGTPFPKDIM